MSLTSHPKAVKLISVHLLRLRRFPIWFGFLGLPGQHLFALRVGHRFWHSVVPRPTALGALWAFATGSTRSPNRRANET